MGLLGEEKTPGGNERKGAKSQKVWWWCLAVKIENMRTGGLKIELGKTGRGDEMPVLAPA